MKKKKYIALSGMAVIFTILAIGINYLTDEDVYESYSSEDICINEVCSSYFPTSFSETQPASDWIELYNASKEIINLESYYLSDDKEDLQKCKLPSLELMPGCYYVIHSNSEEMTDEEARLNFKINSQGETLYLSGGKGTIDIVNIPQMDTNTTWSRLKDAGQEWGNTTLTYGSSNNQAEEILDKIEAPIFSVAGGFYKDEFELELKAPSDCMIYYTLDGSNPNEKSSLYKSPILIKDMSEEPNVYSSRKDFNLLHDGWAKESVEKIAVVRAIAVNADGQKSDIVTNSYIVGRENDKSYAEMYTVSLVTDPDNLFDDKEGIYVLGEDYNNLVAEDSLSNEKQPNYFIDGKKSERPANIEIFDKDGKRILKRQVGIRIHGHTTRERAQKSFSVYARQMYDGEDTIEGIFEENTRLHKFFIYANRDATKIKDVLISRVLADRNMATQSFEYCNVFLDGEYWGVYLLAEVYDEYYFENNYGIARDNIQIHEGATPPDVIEYLNSVSDKSEAAVYEQLCQMIDVQSFIDYYASMLYLNNSDWLDYNARCYRSIKSGQGKNEDGKWRWGVWDIEGTMENAHENTFHMGNLRSWEDDLLAQTLMEHEDFRKQFVITYMDLYNNVWQEDKILNLVSELENSIKESYAMYYERFYGESVTSKYYDIVETFFTERKENAFRHIREEFGLNAEPAWIVILLNKGGAASFRINTSVIDIQETWWQGLYFPDYPIEIKIEEIYGDNVFLGWYTENDELLSTADIITLELCEGTNMIYPKFAVD